MIERYEAEFRQFREELYQNYNNRADTLMELVDAACSNENARSVVELSLTACFRRGHDALYAGIAEYEWETNHLAHLVKGSVPKPKEFPFWLLGVDVTPYPREYAKTLPDRQMVYKPTVVKGNKPVTIGHQFSTAGLLPEAESGVTSSWIVPMATGRVTSKQDKEMVGSKQIRGLLADEQLPWYGELVGEVVDSSYSKRPYLCANRQHANLVTICRVANNRVFYCSPEETDEPAGPGHPTWYGKPFRLQESDSWHAPDETAITTFTSRRGKQYEVQIQGWHNMLMRGERKPTKLPMHQHPFTLVHIALIDLETQQPAFKRPLWLIVMGERRYEVSLLHAYQAYGKRFNLEHFFRFGKQKLLLHAFQTPDDQHEEAWWQLARLAYLQLWMARHLARCLPRPWERCLPSMQQKLISPSLVQRDFGRIIQQLGTPARLPQPRGISAGCPRGRKRNKRQRHKVIVKGQIKENSP